jgi:hypothetical protein
MGACPLVSLGALLSNSGKWLKAYFERKMIEEENRIATLKAERKKDDSNNP